MTLLDGKKVSEIILNDLKKEIDLLKKKPKLVILSVDPTEESKIYINSKSKKAKEIGFLFEHINFDKNELEDNILNKIEELNNDENVNGIIMQLPIPKHFNKEKILNKITPIKDVDGLSDINEGKLVKNSDAVISCTTKGILKLLDYYEINVENKNVVVIGRSYLVGIPTYLSLLHKNANVVMLHSKTKDLSSFTKKADIVISCTGQKYLIDKNMVKKDSCLIDVGVTRIDNKIYGDMNPNVLEVCKYLTPSIGGVGPLTVTMLLDNTYNAYKKMNY